MAAKARAAGMSKAEVAAFLRSRSAEDLLAPHAGAGFGGMYYSPRLLRDGHVLPEDDARVAIAAGRYNAVPTIFGTNRDENKLFLFGDERFIRRWLGFIPRYRDEEGFVYLVGRSREILGADTHGPLVERLPLDATLLLEPRQYLREIGPVLEPEVQPPEQSQCVTVILGVFLETPQRRERLLILLAIELQFRLRQEHCIGGRRCVFVGQFQPFIAALVVALQVRGACRLQVVEKRRVAGRRGARQQLLAARKIALGHLDHAAHQLLSGTPGTVTSGSLADQARRDDKFPDRPDGDHEDDADGVPRPRRRVPAGWPAR